MDFRKKNKEKEDDTIKTLIKEKDDEIDKLKKSISEKDKEIEELTEYKNKYEDCNNKYYELLDNKSQLELNLKLHENKMQNVKSFKRLVVMDYEKLNSPQNIRIEKISKIISEKICFDNINSKNLPNIISLCINVFLTDDIILYEVPDKQTEKIKEHTTLQENKTESTKPQKERNLNKNKNITVQKEQKNEILTSEQENLKNKIKDKLPKIIKKLCSARESDFTYGVLIDDKSIYNIFPYTSKEDNYLIVPIMHLHESLPNFINYIDNLDLDKKTEILSLDNEVNDKYNKLHEAVVKQYEKEETNKCLMMSVFWRTCVEELHEYLQIKSMDLLDEAKDFYNSTVNHLIDICNIPVKKMEIGYDALEKEKLHEDDKKVRNKNKETIEDLFNKFFTEDNKINTSKLNPWLIGYENLNKWHDVKEDIKKHFIEPLIDMEKKEDEKYGLILVIIYECFYKYVKEYYSIKKKKYYNPNTAQRSGQNVR